MERDTIRASAWLIGITLAGTWLLFGNAATAFVLGLVLSELFIAALIVLFVTGLVLLPQLTHPHRLWGAQGVVGFWFFGLLVNSKLNLLHLVTHATVYLPALVWALVGIRWMTKFLQREDVVRSLVGNRHHYED